MYNTLSLLHHNIKPHFDILKHLWQRLLNWSYLFQPRISNNTLLTT